ncbi:MAG: histidine phosphatase family protein [Acidimicrobiales bacterium]
MHQPPGPDGPPPAGHTRLLMVRHGQSTWNAQGRWQGQADPPLSSHGRQQAAAAADRIGAVGAVVSSPQIRALETATTIADAIGVGPVIVVDDLRERHAGGWSGQTTEEIEAAHPGWIDSGRRPDDWEPDQVVQERALRALAAIATELPGETVLVVSHGGVIGALEDHLEVRHGRTPNLHGRVFDTDGERVVAGRRVELIPPEIGTGGTPARV